MKNKLVSILLFNIGVCFLSCNSTTSKRSESNVENRDKKNINLSKDTQMTVPNMVSRTLGDSMVSNCNIEIVTEINKNINSVSKERIRLFLMTIKRECKSNVEFSEFSNEVLFQLIEKRTEEVLLLLNKDENIDLDYIIVMLSNPIDDSINLQSLIREVNKVNINAILKNRITKALKKK